MTFNQIRYFITLSETLNYTEASRMLFITQPNLSRQIKAMEEELGLELFVRHSRSVKLTPAGIVLYKRFSTLVSDYSKAIQAAKLASSDYSGQLSIEILDIYDFKKNFPGLISRVREAHPNLELKLRRNSLGELLSDLKNHHADLILTYGFSLFDQSDLITVDVGTFDSCIMLPADHPLAGEKVVQLSKLNDDLFVQLNPTISAEGARYLDTLIFRSGIHPQVQSVDTMNDVMLYVENENAVAITADCSTEIYNPNVKLLPIDLPETKGHSITFAWRKDNYNPAIAAFMEQVEKSE